MRSRNVAFGLGVVLGIGLSSPALAQQPSTPPVKGYPQCSKPPTQEEFDAAHLKYQAGRVDYDEANYDSAISRFYDAYEKDCTKHDILIIISRAYEQKGDRAEAIRALETYLQRVPTSPEKSTYEKRIAGLRDALEKARQKAAAATPPGDGGGTAAGGTPPPGGGHTIPPWIVVGVGSVVLVAGVIVVATAPSLPDGCDRSKEICTRKPGESDEELNDRQSTAGRAKNQPIIGAGVAAVGGLAVIGGLVWHFLEPTGKESTKDALRPRRGSRGASIPDRGAAKLTPTVAPGYAGISFGASF